MERCESGTLEKEGLEEAWGRDKEKGEGGSGSRESAMCYSLDQREDVGIG
jgi:hypothetical protein